MEDNREGNSREGNSRKGNNREGNNREGNDGDGNSRGKNGREWDSRLGAAGWIERGDTGSRAYFTNADEFVDALRDRLAWQEAEGMEPGGWKVLTEESAVHKAVDDAAYEVQGLKNLTPLDHYRTEGRAGCGMGTEEREHPAGTIACLATGEAWEYASAGEYVAALDSLDPFQLDRYAFETHSGSSAVWLAVDEAVAGKLGWQGQAGLEDSMAAARPKGLVTFFEYRDARLSHYEGLHLVEELEQQMRELSALEPYGGEAGWDGIFDGREAERPDITGQAVAEGKDGETHTLSGGTQTQEAPAQDTGGTRLPEKPAVGWIQDKNGGEAVEYTDPDAFVHDLRRSLCERPEDTAWCLTAHEPAIAKAVHDAVTESYGYHSGMGLDGFDRDSSPGTVKAEIRDMATGKTACFTDSGRFLEALGAIPPFSEGEYAFRIHTANSAVWKAADDQVNARNGTYDRDGLKHCMERQKPEGLLTFDNYMELREPQGRARDAGMEAGKEAPGRQPAAGKGQKRSVLGRLRELKEADAGLREAPGRAAPHRER